MSLVPVAELDRVLTRIDGRGYRAYRDLPRRVDLGGVELRIDHVQGDPFAAPSRVRLVVERSEAGWGAELDDPVRGRALRDWIARAGARVAERLGSRRGSGKSGRISVHRPGQEVLETSAVVATAASLELRFTVGLPARGRSVLGRQARALLVDDCRALADRVLRADAHPVDAVRTHLDTVEDAVWLRRWLAQQDLVAFVADGAVLPRRTGVDDRPMSDAVPFTSPPERRLSVTLPHGGAVAGMGVPVGVTLIVGGGYHGKSTLLRALERGVYDHPPGDGRERVVAVAGATKIRAEDGRSVAGVDISPFVADLPGGRSTRAFRTADASGSTSQAAAIMEALEAGATCLLVDEDTSATNVMIRDARMQALIASDREPITPFVDRVRGLAALGVSTVVVMGGSGDWLDVADTVIGMDAFVPWDATTRAREVAEARPTGRTVEGGGFTRPVERVPLRDSLDPSRGRREVSVRTRGTRDLTFGTEDVDLSAVEQLVHPAQVRAIGEALVWAWRHAMDGATVAELLDRVEEAMEERGLDAIAPRVVGDLAGFRRQELAAALNRLRSLRVATG